MDALPFSAEGGEANVTRFSQQQLLDFFFPGFSGVSWTGFYMPSCREQSCFQGPQGGLNSTPRDRVLI
ncbi:hypothetical protein MYCTH_2306552 [Thermothelomyces thermophilus ATCC 42464]|uniref:Uncharacterized protein n=1 Tax=Thermothelomyces thermophilus (strain ATCC 42464 / BCRC 31852 / DSM 1799) TaxID=573729 RepID=G2QHK6_THET4|nr:uncharacterized protein MYCTH_2306552 [Thermothelomyces thermophilus ATCC 42464]AEO58866.1 hypothetical protein MYCTH_2306552 [Thermothelomyces thermophilus ATCC 42464]